MNTALRNMAVLLTAICLSTLSGCDNESEKKVEDTEDDTGTAPGNEDAGSGDNSDTTTSSPESTDDEKAVCDDFHDFLTNCEEIPAVYVSTLDVYCKTFDEIFIDSYLDGMMSCMTEEGCDAFVEMISEDDTDTPDADGGDDDAALMEQCAMAALLTTEPEQANLDFQDHYCDYLTQCDADISTLECKAEFLSEDLIMFLVLDEKYITKADACVYPMPSCSEAEEAFTCLQGVGEEIGAALEALE